MEKKKKGRPFKAIGDVYICPKCNRTAEMLVNIKSAHCTRCKTKMEKWAKK